MKKSDTEVLKHMSLANGVEIQHERVTGDHAPYENLLIAHHENHALNGMMMKYPSGAHVLEIAILENRQTLTDKDYNAIFDASAQLMGVRRSDIRPALYSGKDNQNAEAGLKTLGKMRRVLGLE